MMALSPVANEEIKFQISFRVDGSKPVVGSSSSSTDGAAVREISIHRRRLIPPDKAPADRLYTAGLPRPTAFARAWDESLISPRGIPYKPAKNSR